MLYNYYNNNINSLTLLKRALLYNIRSLSHCDIKFIYKKLNFFLLFFFFFVIFFISFISVYFNYIIIITL